MWLPHHYVVCNIVGRQFNSAQEAAQKSKTGHLVACCNLGLWIEPTFGLSSEHLTVPMKICFLSIQFSFDLNIELVAILNMRLELEVIDEFLHFLLDISRGVCAFISFGICGCSCCYLLLGLSFCFHFQL